MTLTPDRASVVVGGAFTRINGHANSGMARVSAATGSLRPWAINKTVRNGGRKSAITFLTADRTTVYGSAFSYGTGNFEGAFAAHPRTGAIKWLQDCRGDTYQVAVTAARVYSVGHAHECSNIGGFGETKPLAYRALAVTIGSSGAVQKNPRSRYRSFTGKPAPALVNWFPELKPGTFTGKGQAAWSVAATSRYVVLGGEFTAVNGVAQQGLTRFAISPLAPRRQGPRSGGLRAAPTLHADTDGVVLTWRANHDRDDQLLHYEVLRDGTVLQKARATSQFWLRPLLRFVDRTAEPGVRYGYAIRVRDGDGNVSTSATRFVTASVR
jgi:hypothetical protein